MVGYRVMRYMANGRHLGNELEKVPSRFLRYVSFLLALIDTSSTITEVNLFPHYLKMSYLVSILTKTSWDRIDIFGNFDTTIIITSRI